MIDRIRSFLRSGPSTRAHSVRRRVLRGLGAMAMVAAAAACDPVRPGAVTGSAIDPSAAVPVALLVPLSDPAFGAVARSLENAARLAAADLDGARIDLRVYDTAGNPATAAAATSRAIDGGAQIILGPLLTQTTSAATAAAAGRVAILSFSNNPAVAGGNVFILGPTFANTADRLTAYGARSGIGSVVVVHADDIAGQAGRDAIVGAARRNGVTVAGVESYALSRQGITDAAPRIGAQVQASGADAVFLTANADSDLPLIADTLPAAGVSPGATQYIGLTRWSASPAALRLPGLQGGLFALPDQAVQTQFESRYRAAYGVGAAPLAGLAYDAVQAVGSLVAQGRGDALTPAALTQGAGYAGATGIFRLRGDGTNQRALAVARIDNGQVTIVDPAPRRFGGAGF